MQYFRNTPRRTSDYQNPRTSDMFPLCRGMRENNTNGITERQSTCNRERTDQALENERFPRQSGICGNERTERSCMEEQTNTCGCSNNNRAYENENADTCGCANNDCLNRPSHADNRDGCSCTGLAMAFVPKQEFTELNEPETALCRGTLFRELDMPFYGQRRKM